MPAAEKSRYYLNYTPVSMHAESKSDSEQLEEASESGCVDIHLNVPISSPISMAFYPAAVAFILRITRLLSTLECNAVISGFIGSNRNPVLHLAASLSGFRAECYDVVSTDSAIFDLAPQSRGSASVSFVEYLKKCVLRAGGYEISESGAITISNSSESSVLMIISSSQLLSSHDRVKLLCVMNEDYASLFNEKEIESLSRIMHGSFTNEGDSDASNINIPRNPNILQESPGLEGSGNSDAQEYEAKKVRPL
jgi:hypothetical protein